MSKRKVHRTKFTRRVALDAVRNELTVAGTAPIGEDGNTAHPGDLYKQTKKCIEVIRRAIEKAGGSLTDVIRTRVYLTDVERWEQAAKTHGEFFADIRPACTFLQVSSFIDPEWLVEMEADCVLS